LIDLFLSIHRVNINYSQNKVSVFDALQYLSFVSSNLLYENWN